MRSGFGGIGGLPVRRLTAAGCRLREALDLGLVDGVLRAAIDEAGTVDFMLLPESAITPADIAPLEALLTGYGVWCLIAGVSEPADDGHLGTNWVHVGVRQEQVWRHAAQHKHHRWRLDGRQIGQYNLGGALMPTMQWWEAISIPRRSLPDIGKSEAGVDLLGPAGRLRRCVAVQANDRSRGRAGAAAVVSCEPGKEADRLGCGMGEPWQ